MLSMAPTPAGWGWGMPTLQGTVTSPRGEKGGPDLHQWDLMESPPKLLCPGRALRTSRDLEGGNLPHMGEAWAGPSQKGPMPCSPLGVSACSMSPCLPPGS